MIKLSDARSTGNNTSHARREGGTTHVCFDKDRQIRWQLFKPNHHFHTNYSSADDKSNTPKHTQVHLLPLWADTHKWRNMSVCVYRRSGPGVRPWALEPTVKHMRWSSQQCWNATVTLQPMPSQTHITGTENQTASSLHVWENSYLPADKHTHKQFCDAASTRPWKHFSFKNALKATLESVLRGEKQVVFGWSQSHGTWRAPWSNPLHPYIQNGIPPYNIVGEK